MSSINVVLAPPKTNRERLAALSKLQKRDFQALIEKKSKGALKALHLILANTDKRAKAPVPCLDVGHPTQLQSTRVVRGYNVGCSQAMHMSQMMRFRNFEETTC